MPVVNPTISSQRFTYRPALSCAQCGERLLAPEWSEYLDASRVRHLWACDSCGYAFESLVVFPRDAAELSA